MFYKPKFCCNCGEKVERVDWRLWSSRRFCDVCEIEYKGHEMLPRAIIGLACVFGIFGVGSFFQGHTLEVDKSGQNSIAVSDSRRHLAVEPRPQGPPQQPGSYGVEMGRNELSMPLPLVPQSPPGGLSKEQPRPRNYASDEPVYSCGAMTKKGKPCSRRVKSVNERCWQHAGQPSALPARKATDFY